MDSANLAAGLNFNSVPVTFATIGATSPFRSLVRPLSILNWIIHNRSLSHAIRTAPPNQDRPNVSLATRSRCQRIAGLGFVVDDLGRLVRDYSFQFYSPAESDQLSTIRRLATGRLSGSECRFAPHAAE